jgi:hypothetical protein
MGTYTAENRTLKKGIAKGLAVFERRVLRKMFGGIKVIENFPKHY